IQGLPTWFTVRASHQGWSGRKRDADVFVAMNEESIVDDVAGLRPGATLIVNKPLASYVRRDDVIVHVVPFDELVIPVTKEPKLRKMVVNILYVGVLAHLLDIDPVALEHAIERQFSGKPTSARLNGDAARAGRDWARQHLQLRSSHRLAPMAATAGKII